MQATDTAASIQAPPNLVQLSKEKQRCMCDSKLATDRRAKACPTWWQHQTEDRNGLSNTADLKSLNRINTMSTTTQQPGPQHLVQQKTKVGELLAANIFPALLCPTTRDRASASNWQKSVVMVAW